MTTTTTVSEAQTTTTVDVELTTLRLNPGPTANEVVWLFFFWISEHHHWSSLGSVVLVFEGQTLHQNPQFSADDNHPWNRRRTPSEVHHMDQTPRNDGQKRTQIPKWEAARHQSPSMCQASLRRTCVP